MGEINGRRNGEVWWRLAGLAVAGLVAYFTAIGAIREDVQAVNGRVDVIEQREESHFDEVQRTLLRIERAVERLEQRQ